MTTKPTTDTQTLIAALIILSNDIQSDDGIANACIAEAANRLRELQQENERLRSEVAKLGLDACKFADDTVWCGQSETLIDRVFNILGMEYSGTDEETMATLEALTTEPKETV